MQIRHNKSQKFLITDNADENKTHPAHLPSDRVDIVPTVKARTPNASLHSGRINKVVNRMNITSNPLAADGEKVHTILNNSKYCIFSCNKNSFL